MASHPDYVEYVVEQLREAGSVRARKMFGEYGLFCDGTFFAVICDDQLFIKITPQGEAAFPDLPKAPSHEGARDSFAIEDVDDPTMAVELTRITCEALRRAASQKHGLRNIRHYQASHGRAAIAEKPSF